VAIPYVIVITFTRSLIPPRGSHSSSYAVYFFYCPMSEWSLLWNADYIQLWWTLLHRVTTTMKRIQRFCRRHSRRTTTSWRPKRHDPATPEVPSFDSSKTPGVPGAIWVHHVLPFLDRVSQNRLCATCRDIYDTSKQFGYEADWPQGKFRFKRPINTVAFSPDSSSLAILPANSKMILLWNRRHGLDQTLKGHGGIVSDVSFSPEGILGSCSRTDGTIRLWRKEDTNSTGTEGVPQYRCMRQLVLRVFAMRYLRFSPCGEMIAVWGNDRMIRLERINSGPPSNVGTVPWRTRLGTKCCESVVFPKRSNRNVLAYTFNNEQVRLWNWETQRTVELRDLERTVREGDYDAYLTAMVSVDVKTPDGGIREYLVVGCRVATLKLWDLTDYSCVRSFHLGKGWSAVTNIVFTREGTKMACTGEGSQIRIFDVDTAECVAILKDHRDRVESLSFSSDGQTLASGACDRTVHLWSLHNVLIS
jgi:WD40 repeat protein